MCEDEKIQRLCKWNAGDQFFIISQELISFLESRGVGGKEGRCTVWVENYGENFKISEKDLLWIPNFSQLILAIKECCVLKKISLEFYENEYVYNAYCKSIDTSESIPVKTIGKSIQEACLKALIVVVEYNEKPM